MRLNKVLCIAQTVLLSCAAHADDMPGGGGSRSWRDYTEELRQVGEEMRKEMPAAQEPLLEQELHRFLYGQLAESYLGMFFADPAHPDFWPIFGQGLPHFLPNPDTTYFHTPIDSNGIYRISGFRGTTRIADFQVGNSGLLSRGHGELANGTALGPTYAVYDLDNAHIDPKDGSFEVILSRERPKGYTGDWWKLDDGANYLLGRQVAIDWIHEQDGRFVIDRLDTPAAKPRLTAAEIRGKLDQLASGVKAWTKFDLDFVKRLRERGETNTKLRVNNYSALSGLTNQRYIDGFFDITPQEALIVETEVPSSCRYWGFHLANELWVTLDWANRQTSLNASNSRLDADGKLRFVIAATDPGVANWLDTMGYQRGVISGRWTDCNTYPEPSIRKVKLSEVRDHLPASTRAMSPEAREEEIRLRRRGAQLRRRW